MESAIRGQNSGIQELSRRPDPAIEIDEHGNSESDLLYAGFTYVALCVDEGDKVETVKQKLLPPVPGAPQRQYEVLSFEFHGTLHFDWASCILVARSFDDPSEDPMTQIQRMLYCIQIAHSYLGTCVAFEDLFFHETLRQADGYVKGIPGGRDPRELNRLRTLALAVVSLTSYAAITATEEDQSYFDCYERHAKIRERHQIIQDRCEILLNVQVAETQSEEAKRQQLLNGVVLFLTAFTFLSVFADSYTFLQEGEHWLPHLLHRVVVLVCIGFACLGDLGYLEEKYFARPWPPGKHVTSAVFRSSGELFVGRFAVVAECLTRSWRRCHQRDHSSRKLALGFSA
jgi:hypothetical protein